ncbi:hypothetical protein Q8F55_005458 [Vanrija albida]|uniref:Dienelactone hydrolase domain-containing protein n=1 Tax=Vanrija albida TaxID=181172 RepID=A0ABR3Q1P9_9TREE
MSEQTSVKSCCTSGHIHAGTPEGAFKQLHGLNTYVTGSGKDTIVFLPDIFGVYPNAQLLADEWARLGGWRVVIPDVFQGDAVSLDHLNLVVPKAEILDKRTEQGKQEQGAKTMELLGPWLGKHPQEVVWPLIETFVKGVKAESGKVGVVGFCWGGRYAILLGGGASPLVDSVVANHPSFLSDADIAGVTKTPVAIFWGDRDEILPAAQLDGFEAVLTKNLGASKLLVKRYAGAVHGFTIRGDDQNEREKKNKEEAATLAVDFTKKAFAQSAAL